MKHVHSVRPFVSFSVNVESCTKSKLTVSTFEATENGLIYIQGQGENCKQPTFSGLAFHDFDFEACGIEWVIILIVWPEEGSD